MMRFEEWLDAQMSRKDFIGEFAYFWGRQDISSVVSKHEVEDYHQWAELVSRIALPRHISAFDAAWSLTAPERRGQ